MPVIPLNWFEQLSKGTSLTCMVTSRIRVWEKTKGLIRLVVGSIALMQIKIPFNVKYQVAEWF